MSLGDQAQQKQILGDKENKKKEDPAACVFVASLSKDVPDTELQSDVYQHFLQWGTLSSVKVLKDWLKRPYAFVQFERTEDSKRAIKEAPGTILHGRSIRCEPARVNRSICLVSFSQPFHKKFIHSALSTFGEIEEINILQPHGKFHSTVVKFRYREDAIKAYLALKFSDFEQINRYQQKWFVEWASNMDADNLYGICSNECRLDKSSVFVGNLPQCTQQEELHNLFDSYGKVLHVHLVQKPYNRYPEKTKFAFIKYQHPFEAARAIDQENGNIFKGKTLRVSYRQHYQRNSCYPNNKTLTPMPPPEYFQPKLIEEYAPPQYMAVGDSSATINHAERVYQQTNSTGYTAPFYGTKDYSKNPCYMESYPTIVYYAYPPYYPYKQVGYYNNQGKTSLGTEQPAHSY